MQCVGQRPTDAELRPWAYTDLQVMERVRADTKEREDRAQRALVKIGGGLNWWQQE